MQIENILSKLNWEVLEELSGFLSQLKESDYANLSPVLKTASIGQHVRHILELYDCLQNQYPSGIICYDKRKRDQALETEVNVALNKIAAIQAKLDFPDKELSLKVDAGLASQFIQSSYHRELFYNLEHCIHHQALIKIACNQLEYIQLPSSFGVAKSTLAYVKQQSITFG